MTVRANSKGEVKGKFTIPEGISAGTKRVELIGEQGTLAIGQFIGSGTIRIEERRRIVYVRPNDPLAQTFRLNEARHVCSIGLWFVDIGSRAVTVQIRNTTVGIPNNEVLAEVRLQVKNINPTGETVIDFPVPVFLEAFQEYALVILSDDNTHSLAIAELGQYDKTSKQYVTSQGYAVGALLSSSNASTWTPHNEADLTFRIYAARFTETTKTYPLKDFDLNQTTELQINADVERINSATDLFFTVSNETENYKTQENQIVILNERKESGSFKTNAVLRGTEKHSPLLYPSIWGVNGNLQESATYISRRIPAGKKEAILYLESKIPSGANVKVEIEINGVFKTCEPQNGEPLGDGWVLNEYKQRITGGDEVRCRLTLTGTIKARPECRQLRMVTV